MNSRPIRFFALGVAWTFVLLLLCLTPALRAEETAPAVKDAAGGMAVVVQLSGYGFVPVNRDWAIDQPQPRAGARIQLKEGSHRMPMSEPIPRWSGTTDIALKDGYHVKISAVYMVGRPVADFVRDENGLSINVSYYHEKQLIDFESTTDWAKAGKPKVSVSLKDIPYCDLLNQNGFDIPSEVGGYGEGFRYWVAVRDGLNQRDGNSSYETLSKFLQPLGRKNNLILPLVTLECKLAEPAEAKTLKEKKSDKP